MRVSALSALAEGVFEECNLRSWPTLERSSVVLDLAGARVLIQSEGGRLTLDGPAMVVPLRTLIESLRRALLAGDDDSQQMLPFPPVAQPIGSLRRRAG
jgi:hypothetical protein